jgi:undecaprenyl-diphosphatase
LRQAAIVLAHSGDSPVWLVGLGVGWWLGPTSLTTMLAAGFVGVLITALVVQLLKLIFRRQRPAGEWGQVYRKLDPHSFPSGHAARAVMLAGVAVTFGPLWLAVVMVVWAISVSLARVALGVHYLSDIVAGGVCGLVCAVGIRLGFLGL